MLLIRPISFCHVTEQPFFLLWRQQSCAQTRLMKFLSVFGDWMQPAIISLNNVLFYRPITFPYLIRVVLRLHTVKCAITADVQRVYAQFKSQLTDKKIASDFCGYRQLVNLFTKRGISVTGEITTPYIHASSTIHLGQTALCRVSNQDSHQAPSTDTTNASTLNCLRCWILCTALNSWWGADLPSFLSKVCVILNSSNNHSYYQE